MKSIDQREQAGSDTDAMARRLKNRERQRRYRARKRLESDKGKGPVAIQSDQVQPDSGKVHHSISRYEPRVHCTRKWKKDARRRAHLATTSSVKSGLASDGALLSNKPSPGRRNWKAEARKKKR